MIVPRPKWELVDLLHKRFELLDLIGDYRAELEPRLAPGLIDALVANLGTLDDARTGASNSKTSRKAATWDKRQAITRAARLAMTLRKAVCATFPTKHPARARFGIRTPIDVRSMISVGRALSTLLDGMEQEPETARAAGILPGDVAAIEAAHNALVAAGTRREVQHIDTKLLVLDRNALQREVEAAMTRLNAVANIAFVDRPEVLARFRAAMPVGRGERARRRKRQAKRDSMRTPPADDGRGADGAQAPREGEGTNPGST